MAKKSRERVVFEAQIASLREEAEGCREIGDDQHRLAKAADEKADLIQTGLDEAEAELKRLAELKASTTAEATEPNGDDDGETGEGGDDGDEG